MDRSRNTSGLRRLPVRAPLVVTVFVLMVVAVWVLALWRGDGGQAVRVEGSGSVAEDGDAREEPNPDVDDDDATVVVELPSALSDQEPQAVEVGAPESADESESLAAAMGSGPGPVPVDDVSVEHRRRLLGQEVEIEGRVQRPGRAGFWLLPVDTDVDTEPVFVTWGDGDRGVRDGEVVTVSGVWRLAAEADKHLERAGATPDTPYVHALGWQR